MNKQMMPANSSAKSTKLETESKEMGLLGKRTADKRIEDDIEMAKLREAIVGFEQ